MSAARVRPLDGIRGIAVFLVILHHYTEEGFYQDLGNIGVQLFFVLSGFLITGILLELRESLESTDIQLGEALSRFWQSRIARILPVVLLTLAGVAIIGDRIEPRSNLVWHATFTSNVLFFLRGDYGSNLAHFWSLAVEQQFYLTWPFIILLVRRRALEPFVIGLILLAPAVRFALYTAGFTNFAEYNVLPVSNFDSLGAGALLALWMREEPVKAEARLRLLGWLAAAAAAAFIANRAFGRIPWNAEQLFTAIMSAWLIATVVRYPVSFAARALNWKPLVALGVISYGVYAYHVFAPRSVGFVLRQLHIPEWFHSGVPLVVLSFITTVGVAACSWRLMERPINDARRRWQQRSTLSGLTRAARAEHLRATE